MQFLLLIYDQEKRWNKLSEAQQNSETQEYGTFGKEFAKAIRGGNALQPNADGEDCKGTQRETSGNRWAVC